MWSTGNRLLGVLGATRELLAPRCALLSPAFHLAEFIQLPHSPSCTTGLAQMEEHRSYGTPLCGFGVGWHGQLSRRPLWERSKPSGEYITSTPFKLTRIAILTGQPLVNPMLSLASAKPSGRVRCYFGASLVASHRPRSLQNVSKWIRACSKSRVEGSGGDAVPFSRAQAPVAERRFGAERHQFATERAHHLPIHVGAYL